MKKLLGSLELNRIYQRDVIEGMKMIPDNSIYLIIADPPYNIGKKEIILKQMTTSSEQ